MTILTMLETVLGTPPEGYEYLVYKTACVLFVLFCSTFSAMLLLFQRSFQRGGK